jgi:hypothetical protein
VERCGLEKGERVDVQVGMGFYAGAGEVEVPELGWGEDAEVFAAFGGDCGRFSV